jgi:hypothetical protein
MAESVTVVVSGGVLVTESLDNTGTPLTPADNARPVTIGSGGPEVTFVGIDGILWPGGVPPSGTLIAGTGSYAWTGQDATLTVTTLKSVAADSGSYLWTGDDATPVQNHILGDAGGSYAWTGQDATLTKSSSTTTWNPSDKNAGIALTNGNLTATRSGGSGDAGVRSIASTSTAKVYWEITADTLTNTNNAFGVANSTWNLTWVDGSFNNAGSWGLNALLPYASGDVIGVALDATARKVWYRVNGGSWGPSGDPAAGTGGRDISTLTGALYALVFSNPNGDGHTANFGATAYANSAPSGFGNLS